MSVAPVPFNIACFVLGSCAGKLAAWLHTWCVSESLYDVRSGPVVASMHLLFLRQLAVLALISTCPSFFHVSLP